MAHLEQLKINNFRGFDSLEIDGLSKINLFVGKNNSGKTSILEALFL
ncbi:MAG: AAA family ATPase, partial [Dysgonamonadaceae bacterium]|nr:AAA family ATPase [Dysgonamonadaceae bacterium]